MFVDNREAMFDERVAMCVPSKYLVISISILEVRFTIVLLGTFPTLGFSV